MMLLLDAVTAIAVGVAVAADGTAGASCEAAFLRGNSAAMERMMSGMSARSTGMPDVDFVNLMEPHHQGAIDMAVLELRYGTNEQLRRIAQEIVIEQQQEIAAMRLALGRTLPASSPSPTQRPSPRLVEDSCNAEHPPHPASSFRR